MGFSAPTGSLRVSGSERAPRASEESTAKDEALDATEEELSESRQPRSDRN
jgi:hypothetical protein